MAAMRNLWKLVPEYRLKQVERVRVTKKVITEQKQITLSARRQKLEIERSAADPERSGAPEPGGGGGNYLTVRTASLLSMKSRSRS